jgi:hypothetical protein
VLHNLKSVFDLCDRKKVRRKNYIGAEKLDFSSSEGCNWFSLRQNMLIRLYKYYEKEFTVYSNSTLEI